MHTKVSNDFTHQLDTDILSTNTTWWQIEFIWQVALDKLQ